MSLTSAGRDERRKAVEKLYKMRLTWGEEWQREKVQMRLHLRNQTNVWKRNCENRQDANCALPWWSAIITGVNPPSLLYCISLNHYICSLRGGIYRSHSRLPWCGRRRRGSGIPQSSDNSPWRRSSRFPLSPPGHGHRTTPCRWETRRSRYQRPGPRPWRTHTHKNVRFCDLLNTSIIQISLEWKVNISYIYIFYVYTYTR